MAKPRPTLGALQVHVEYLFDRLHESKLVQAYSLLVPLRERPVGGSVNESRGTKYAELTANSPGSRVVLSCAMNTAPL